MIYLIICVITVLVLILIPTKYYVRYTSVTGFTIALVMVSVSCVVSLVYIIELIRI